jgi:hypothetical protein
VLFAGGSEVSVIDEPRLIEVVRCDAAWGSGAPWAAWVLETATTIALAPAEANQVSGGGSNARFGTIFDAPPADELPTVARTCAIVADRPEVATTVSGSLEARGVVCHRIDSPVALADIDSLDAVVVALSGAPPASGAASDWERILAEHEGIVARITTDVQWTRAIAQLAATNGRSVRLVTVTDGICAGGRSRAQASAQLARAGRKATRDLVLPFAVSVESDGAGFDRTSAELVAHLVCDESAVELAGAELVSGIGWFGIRSHPRPIGSISFGGPAVPSWFDDALREVVQPR